MRIRSSTSPLLIALLLSSGPFTGWAQPQPDRVAEFRSGKLREIDQEIEKSIAGKNCPGGVFWLERQGTSYHRAYGQRALVPKPEDMTGDTIFDAASLTKVLATTPAILLLAERGLIDLEAPAGRYLPEFRGPGTERITIRHLLTHTSGLKPGISGMAGWSGYNHGIDLACAEVPTSSPGTTFRYSDVNFILLGEIVRRISGAGLNEFTEKEFYRPLGMKDTGFLPSAEKLGRIAPTEELDEGKVLRGVVHDPTARRMGGVAGHAGVFTTAADLARFARMMLNQGELDGVRVFKPETIRRMTSVQSPPEVPARRGLGWDIDSPYAGPRGLWYPIGSYGHTGWTGTSLWIDPFSQSFWIFLSNRNHPNENGGVTGLRRALGTLAAEAISDFNFVSVPGALRPLTNDAAAKESPRRDPLETADVLQGIDVLSRQNFAPLKKLRVGLITNHTGQNRRRISTIDLLKNATEVQLVALFSPEHGIRGLADEKVSDTVDEKTGLPVYSLYGDARKPAPAQLQNLDALVFDIQDIGTRFYTYISTMGLAMQAAAEAKLKFFVLDRVNPINGIAVEGPVSGGESSFTAFHRLPVRHGMTAGELARMFNAELGWRAELTVIPVEGWKRAFWFDQTGLPWTKPSPNMRNLTEATLYPGIGLLETAVSVGRGTDTPFEIVGAPYVDDLRLAAEMNRAGLSGVRFVPTRFTPRASVFKDRECGGIQILIIDRDSLNPVSLGITLASALQRLYPQDFALDKVQTLLQHQATIDAIRAGRSLPEIRKLWADDIEQFRKRRERHLIYK